MSVKPVAIHPFIGNGWLMPWGEVVSNPLRAQRLAEEYRERQEAA
ncbi:DUF1317 family protein [Enterobacter hormaechei]